MQIGQLGDAHAGLQEELDNSRNADIQTDGVTEIFDFGGSEDAGGVGFDFGVGEGGAGILWK